MSNRVRPRSMRNYSEETRQKARELYLRWCFADKHFDNGAFVKAVRAGQHDNTEMVKLCGFAQSEIDRIVQEEIDKLFESFGVKCEGCGSGWTNEDLADAQRMRKAKGGPPLWSCCPDRKPVLVYRKRENSE